MPTDLALPVIPQAAVNAAAGGTVITSVFYTSTLIAQRISGSLRIHSGKAYPLTVVWGACSTAICLAFTHYNTEIISQSISHVLTKEIPNVLRQIGLEFNDYTPSSHRSGKGKNRGGDSIDDAIKMLEGIKIDYFPGKRWWQSRHSAVQHDAKQLFLGLSLYALFERRSFRTALPSTLISTGSYAHTPVHWHRKLPSVLLATSEVASSAQRRIIQQLGKIHGCHHCGSRQLVSPLVFNTSPNFIADHMPPTKLIKEKNVAWYRQMTGILAKQQLLPQCQTCFSRQGSAVKAGIDALAYHRPFRSWHLAPAAAYLLLLSEKQVLASSSSSSSSSITAPEVLENLSFLPYRLLQECRIFDVIDWLTGQPPVLEMIDFVESWIKLK